MVQKRPRCGGDLNLLAAPFDGEAVESLFCRSGLALGGAKCREIVTSDQKLCGLMHGGDIKTPRHPPGTPTIERQIGPTIDDTIEVVSADGREPRIKAIRHPLDGQHGDRVWSQLRI